MGLTYTRIPTNTFTELVLNAGILVDSFTPATGVIGNILGATTGGLHFTATPSFLDFGADIDNCPKNTKELMQTDDWDINMTGTLLTVNASMVERLLALADASTVSTGLSKIDLRKTIDLENDFKDVWLIADYGEGGFIAIHMKDTMSTGGFQLQTADKGKGQFPFTFTAHYSIDAQDDVPCEIYVQEGSANNVPSVTLNKHYIELTVGDTFTFSPYVVPSGSTVSYTSSASGKASVNSDGKVTALEAGSTTITATITVSTVAYTDTCTVKVNAAQ